MLFKSNASTEQKQAWTISAVAHGALASAVLIVAVLGSRPDTVPLDIVIESPVQSQAAKVAELKKPVEKTPDRPKPRAVYGISRKAITSVSGDDVKAGNTVAKTPDQETLKPGDEDVLPIPADEYLVSRMPRLKTEIRIPYPPEARKKNIQGAVVMDILIDASGNVREAKFVSGPGYGLDEAAMGAVRDFQFEPALVQEKPVAVRIRYAYRFVLER